MQQKNVDFRIYKITYLYKKLHQAPNKKCVCFFNKIFSSKKFCNFVKNIYNILPHLLIWRFLILFAQNTQNFISF